MYFKIYFYLLFVFLSKIVADEEYSERDKSEIELYRQLFLRLNTIIKNNIELSEDIKELKSDVSKLKEKCGSSAPQEAAPSFHPIMSVCSFSNKGGANIDPHIDSSHCFGDGWIVIQRRIDGSVNFDVNWNDYKKGFGNVSKEFFIGLENLYAMTLVKPYELLIVLQDFDDDVRYAKYDSFQIGNEVEQYSLKALGHYSGSAGDSLRYHKNAKFSTKDRDNDEHQHISCAQKFGGGWWFKSCHESNLNGHYVHSDHSRSYASGIHWKDFRPNWYSLKFSQMMVRPKQ